MKRLLLLSVLFLMLLTFSLGLYIGQERESLQTYYWQQEALKWHEKFYKPVSAGLSVAEAINILERARESHVYFADHEDEAPWATYANQDRDWVIAYTRIIELVKTLSHDIQ